MTASALFYLFALIAAGGALGVVISKNIVRMALYLLFTLLGVAGLYFLLEAEFLAAVQLVVYAGGTLILIIFGVMLTSKSPFSRFASRAEVIVAVVVNVVLLAALLIAIESAPFKGTDPSLANQRYPMAALGTALLGEFLVPFEIASVLLLAVMIGAAYLAKARKKEPMIVRGKAATGESPADPLGVKP